MKNYVVSALISLSLASPFTLADEATPVAPVVTPTSEIHASELPEHIAKAQAEANARMEAAQAKREAHQQEMQALMEKMKQAETLEARQTLMQERMELMQKHQQEMQQLVHPEMPEQMPEAWAQTIQQRMEALQKYRYGQQYYGMGGYAAPSYNYPAPPAPYYGGYYAPSYDYPVPPRMTNRGQNCNKSDTKQKMMEQKMSHHKAMEQGIQNVEATLKEILELMKAK